jgi:hypothetical protein
MCPSSMQCICNANASPCAAAAGADGLIFGGSGSIRLLPVEGGTVQRQQWRLRNQQHTAPVK